MIVVLPGPGGADERDQLAGPRLERDPAQHGFARFVGEGHVVEPQLAARRRQGRGSRALRHFLVEIEVGEDAVEQRDRRHEIDVHVDQGRGRAVEPAQVGHEGDDRAHREGVLNREPAAVAPDQCGAHRGEQQQKEEEPAPHQVLPHGQPLDLTVLLAEAPGLVLARAEEPDQ